MAHVLDVAAALVDTEGADAVTIRALAEAAATSPASIYRYFADRRAVLRALAARNLDRFGARLVVALDGAEAPLDWWTTVSVAVDQFVAMHREEPSFFALRFGDAIDEHLLAGDRTNNAVLGGLLLELGDELLGVERSDEVDRAVAVAVEITDAVLRHAFRLDPAGDEPTILECRRLLYDYLSPYLGPPTAPRP